MDPSKLSTIADLLARLQLSPREAEELWDLTAARMRATPGVVITEEQVQAVVPATAAPVLTSLLEGVQGADSILPAPPTVGDQRSRAEEPYVPLRRPRTPAPGVLGRSGPSTPILSMKKEVQALPACTPEDVLEAARQDEARALEPTQSASRPWAEVEADFAAAEAKLREAMTGAKVAAEEVRRARADPARADAIGASLQPRLREMEGAVEGADRARAREDQRRRRDQVLKQQLEAKRVRAQEARRDYEEGRRQDQQRRWRMENAESAVVFAEAEEIRRERREEAWQATPERFYCPVCQTRGVRQGKRCPNKKNHYLYYRH